MEPESTSSTLKRSQDPEAFFIEEIKRKKTTTMACNQTAVAVLQELCMKRKWNPPLYETLDLGGPPNDPIFEVSVTLCNNVKASGRGRQKKAAKHAAAQKALAQLQGKALTDGSENVEALPTKGPINPHEDVGSTNAVGQLQELCASKRLPSPEYTVVGDEGEPHEKLFTMKCSVSEMSQTGTARKKQHAKHLAAQNMLAHLNDNLKQFLDEIPSDPAVSFMYSQKSKEASEKERERDQVILDRFKNLKEASDGLPSSAPQISPGVKFSNYHQAYEKQLEGLEEILNKPEVKTESNLEKKVGMVAFNLNLKLTKTVDIGKDKRFIVFLQLDTHPATVQAGHHENETVATQQAASSVLEFLSIMSK